MKNPIRMFVAVWLSSLPLVPGAESDVKGLLVQLQSDDTDTRYEAMRQFRHEESTRALGFKESAEFGPLFFSSIVGWTAVGLEFKVSFSVKLGEEYIDFDDVRILWNPVRDSFTALP